MSTNSQTSEAQPQRNTVTVLPNVWQPRYEKLRVHVQRPCHDQPLFNKRRGGINGHHYHVLSPDLIVVERVERRSHPHETPGGAFAVVGPGLKGNARQTARDTEPSCGDTDEGIG